MGDNSYIPSYTRDDPTMNVPVTSKNNLSQLSPYLNFDPGYLPPSQPEFIFLDGAARQRGRFELAFAQVSNNFNAEYFNNIDNNQSNQLTSSMDVKLEIISMAALHSKLL